jgi:shikimate dehydrogenase
MDNYGLIGKKLSHSFSKKYFEEKFENLNINAQYHLFEIEKIADIKQIIAHNPNLKGFNVTIPYKESIIPYLDMLHEDAYATNSVNCVKKEKDKWIGYNTDIIGFEFSLLNDFLPKDFNSEALILGNGGASKAVQYVLKKLEIAYTIVTRDSNSNNYLNYISLNKSVIDTHQLIINTTPVGMYPNIKEKLNFPFHLISSKHFLLDLIYNPLETYFLEKGTKKGATTQNGILMLHTQAEASWDIWSRP